MSTKDIYNEPRLLSRAAIGNREDFTALYSRHLDAVTQYIQLFTRSQAETDEIIQDVFVRIWEQREKLANVTSFKAYVARAAKNRLMDHLRHYQVRKAALFDLQQQEASVVETPEDIWNYKFFYDKVQRQIAVLPTQCQRIFRLSVENGLSLDEISAQLQISKSGVKHQLYKAQKLVRQCFDEKDSVAFLLLMLTVPSLQTIF